MEGREGGRVRGMVEGRERGKEEEDDRFPKFLVSFMFQHFLSSQCIDLAAQFSNFEQNSLKLYLSVFHLAVEAKVIKAISSHDSILSEFFKEQAGHSNKVQHVPILAKVLCLTGTCLIVPRIIRFRHIPVKSMESVTFAPRRRVVPLLTYYTSLLC